MWFVLNDMQCTQVNFHSTSGMKTLNMFSFYENVIQSKNDYEERRQVPFGLDIHIGISCYFIIADWYTIAFLTTATCYLQSKVKYLLSQSKEKSLSHRCLLFRWGQACICHVLVLFPQVGTTLGLLHTGREHITSQCMNSHKILIWVFVSVYSIHWHWEVVELVENKFWERSIQTKFVR